MKFILQQLTKIQNIETNELKEEWSKPESVQVIETDGKKLFKVASQYSYPDSSASMTAGKITTTVSHHATCIELGFHKTEVSIKRDNLINKLKEIYDIEVL
ncbi:MAG TPA: hypothetical protein VHZ50_01565 [Puia sp.]|jgi:hypothetical protein|nr:hypothetical protein [Puia sp.]